MTSDAKESIENRLVLEVEYPPGVRLIEPHALGIGSSGQTLLRAFQTDGASASGESPHWKLFRMDRMKSLSVTGQKFFGPRDGYKRGDRAMKGGIIAEL